MIFGTHTLHRFPEDLYNAIREKKGVLEKILGIGPDREIKAGMGLGMPQFRYPNYIDKKELKFTEVK